MIAFYTQDGRYMANADDVERIAIAEARLARLRQENVLAWVRHVCDKHPAFRPATLRLFYWVMWKGAEALRISFGQHRLTDEEQARIACACKQVWAERFTTTMRRAA